MRSVIATTDVLAHDNRFPRGTGFVVVAKPDPAATPPEVDARTADAWLRGDWAMETTPRKAVKSHAG